jgi:sulfotransferase
MTFSFLSGLPRTGSTLLSAILSQNPQIHAEGNSAVCQIMWDVNSSCEGSASEQLKATGRIDTQQSLMSAVPAIYYKDVKATHIVDKCRSWTLPANMKMIRSYITDKPKVIVMTRPIDEIVESFVRLRKGNGWTGDLESDLFVQGSEPIMRSLEGVKWAQENNNGEFLFVEYADLVSDTQAVINKVYEFCEWDYFSHYFTGIENKFQEDDSVYSLAGLHDIRPEIGLRIN